jgi:hypothetical protein
VEVDSYRQHPFYKQEQQWVKTARATCPRVVDAAGLSPARQSGSGSGDREPSDACRFVYRDEFAPRIFPAPPAAVLTPEVDTAVESVVAVGAIGIFGYLLPSRVHVVDLHGLADPIASHFKLDRRGRPGHEKRLSASWLYGRFASPAPEEDAAITAARHALRCDPLADLLRSIQGPITLHDFVSNVARSWGFSRLRIPSDPFEAEVRFCHTPPLVERSVGGAGGDPFRWRCPRGRALSAVHGSLDVNNGAFAHIQAVCGSGAAVGPEFGEPTRLRFESECPPEAAVTGLYGTWDDVVRSAGLVCTQGQGRFRASEYGTSSGQAFNLECPAGQRVVGVEGRTGSLVDAIGIVCGP